ncbi:unnamed protein product [Rangifer tarandus platyrhynchus]|uniref:Uncharacterized protein n=1 Tax=Rangifer tarandus platyrhynchus TaxID=3082113 RepID=A0AC60A5D0_RANTA
MKRCGSTQLECRCLQEAFTPCPALRSARISQGSPPVGHTSCGQLWVQSLPQRTWVLLPHIPEPGMGSAQGHMTTNPLSQQRGLFFCLSGCKFQLSQSSSS